MASEENKREQEISDSHENAVDSILASITKRRYAPFEIRTMADLIENPPPETDWLLDGVLARGTTSLVAAAPKSGKSTILRQMVHAISNGQPFLGRDTSRGKALFFAMEELDYEVYQHGYHLVEQLGGTTENILFTFNAPLTTSVFDSMREEIESRLPDIVVVDPFIFSAGGVDVNDYSKIYPAISKWNKIAVDNNCHIVLVHHTGKGMDGDEFQKVLGSTALVAAVFTIINISKDTNSEDRFIQSRQKAGTQIERTKITFDKETRISKFEIDAQNVVSRDSQKIDKLLKAISPTGTYLQELRVKVSMKADTRHKLLDELLSKGEIYRREVGSKLVYYRGNEEQGTATTVADVVSIDDGWDNL